MRNSSPLRTAPKATPRRRTSSTLRTSEYSKRKPRAADELRRLDPVEREARAVPRQQALVAVPSTSAGRIDALKVSGSHVLAAARRRRDQLAVPDADVELQGVDGRGPRRSRSRVLSAWPRSNRFHGLDHLDRRGGRAPASRRSPPCSTTAQPASVEDEQQGRGTDATRGHDFPSEDDRCGSGRRPGASGVELEVAGERGRLASAWPSALRWM